MLKIWVACSALPAKIAVMKDQNKYYYLRINSSEENQDDPEMRSDRILIDHNKFHDKQRSRGSFVHIGNSWCTNTVIERNYFFNNPGTTDYKNPAEALRVGFSAVYKKPFEAQVRYNLFEKCNGDPECISNKSSKNKYSYNTFRKNRGSLCFRHGSSNTAEWNFFDGGHRGIRVYP